MHIEEGKEYRHETYNQILHKGEIQMCRMGVKSMFRTPMGMGFDIGIGERNSVEKCISDGYLTNNLSEAFYKDLKALTALRSDW